MSYPKVLVVHDEPLLLRFLAAVLFRYGYDAIAVESNRTAVETARRHRSEIALIVSDIDTRMPGMDGFRPVAELRNLIDVPVLLLSREIPEALVPEASWLMKPFTPKELASKVAVLLPDVQPQSRAR